MKHCMICMISDLNTVRDKWDKYKIAKNSFTSVYQPGKGMVLTSLHTPL